MSYNGWTNYETWAVALWIDNTEPEYRQWTDRARELAEDGPDDPHGFLARGTFTAETMAETQLAEELQEWAEDNVPDLEGMWADLLGAALSEVNWREVAAHYAPAVEESATPAPGGAVRS